MSAILMLAMGLSGMAMGYFIYSKFIAEKIFRLSDDFLTPAHEFEDGIDFVPTNRYVLWGHHFTSVAGAAPIVGPAIAVIWGWVPAFLWVGAPSSSPACTIPAQSGPACATGLVR